MHFSIEISLLVCVLLGAALLALLYITLVYVLRVRPVARRCHRPLADVPESLPGASVVVWSHSEADALERLLGRLLAQDYPGPFEVVVVNEGESPEVAYVVDSLSRMYPNMYLTRTPDGAVGLSRKKLALTLGVKAARYPVVVHTMATANIPSDRWLAAMMHRFTDPAIDVVLGPVAVSSLGRMASFCSTADQVQSLADALAGHPWRGSEYCLAYRREAFFRNKGFSRSLNVRGGDDDIFISEIARRDNTAVELSEEAFVDCGPLPWGTRRRSRNFTAGFIHKRPRFVFAAMWWAHPLVLAAAVAAAVVACPNVLPAIVAVLIVLLMALADVLAWRSLASAMSGRRLMLTIPLLALLRPFALLWLRLTPTHGRPKRYTWD